ncbi:hypothetical protein [Erythrobacter sp.]|nr:hypothetical protein [Erythrobacter sp.]
MNSAFWRKDPDLQHDPGKSAVRAAMLADIGRFLDDAMGVT